MVIIVIISIIAIVVIGIIGWVIRTSNRFKILKVKIDEADSGIDVALTKRHDTLTKMLDVVKAYAKHEVETFTQIVNLRKGMNIAEKTEANKCMDEIVKGINVLAEAYPELRSSDNFIKLKSAISETETHLQAARRLYNSNVSIFNQAIVVFPASIIANSQNHTPRDFFEADETSRTDVKMNF